VRASAANSLLSRSRGVPPVIYALITDVALVWALMSTVVIAMALMLLIGKVTDWMHSRRHRLGRRPEPQDSLLNSNATGRLGEAA
jgi:hypothetical protein